MHVHINHMFCRDSNWGGMYDSRYMVSINKRLGYKQGAPLQKDWKLLEEFEVLDEERFNFHKNHKDNTMSETALRRVCQKESRRLNPEVFKWLEDNVQDSSKGDKGFCVGSDQYNARAFDEFSIFFYRRADALKFIKRWSEYKKPTTYFDYFRSVRKEIDFKTGKLKVVDELTLF